MISINKKYKYRLINVLTNIDLIDNETKDLILNHSYFEKVENDDNVYYVIQDKDDSINAIITMGNALQAESEGLGYFRYTKNNERIFVFTRTYPDNYLNCGIYDYVDNKSLFSPTVNYKILKEMASNELEKPYTGVLVKNNIVYLISSKTVYSNEVLLNSGFQHEDYLYWEFYNEPRILYKYIVRN